MSTLAAIQTINDALTLANAVTRAMQIAALAGREVTLEEVEQAKTSLISSEKELQAAIDNYKATK